MEWEYLELVVDYHHGRWYASTGEHGELTEVVFDEWPMRTVHGILDRLGRDRWEIAAPFMEHGSTYRLLLKRTRSI